MTYTTDASAEIVRRNLHTSAMYSGQIEGVGPRYCPSIEDKFVRFADKPRHLLFLEPEGRHTDEYYINGLSTSMPFEVQLELVRSIPGLERAVLLRPAYAVEYDFALPTQLHPSLESRKVEGLFFAGQINGTSGYEEAAGQGIVAGINAAQKVLGEAPLVLGRHEAYIGVLIDDLVTKGTSEPYRMFTSRAEHRLLLNHGSAELRLLHHAARLSLLPTKRLSRITQKQDSVLRWTNQLETIRHQGLSMGDHIRRNANLPDCLPSSFLQEPTGVQGEVVYRIRYRGYLERESRIAERMAGLDRVRIPDGMDFMQIRGLRRECALKLSQLRPDTLGQASRISGVSPADLAVLLVRIEASGSGRTSYPPHTPGDSSSKCGAGE
jgi:tRNA uridine 5-carboxymethylaminomethyl modification enzyme